MRSKLLFGNVIINRNVFLNSYSQSFFLDNLPHNFCTLNRIRENILVLNKKITAVSTMIGKISLNENFSN